MTVRTSGDATFEASQPNKLVSHSVPPRRSIVASIAEAQARNEKEFF